MELQSRNTRGTSKLRKKEAGIGSFKNLFYWPWALVQWLKEESHNQKVVSSNPGTGHWMGIVWHEFVVKFVLFV